MERRRDIYIGTLSKIIEAMGGEMEVRANFPDGSMPASWRNSFTFRVSLFI